MAIAAGMGLIWTSFIRPRIAHSWASLPILATLISAHGLASFMFPTEIAALFFLKIMPVLFVLNFVDTIAFATLINRERNLLGETSMLLQAATTDPLTRAMNRRSVMDEYGNLEMLNHPYRGIAIVCIAVDNFKVTNDTYGHLAGDKVLVEISSRIKSCLRGGDLFARMSGDKFLIVLTNVASHEAQVITERCRKIISRVPVAFEGRTIDTSISVGTVWSPRFEPFGEFRDAADVALYRAKSAGRDCMAFNRKHDFDLQTALDAA
jgi:diguanylate cyclase (GGDEF)-like protein